MPNIFLVGFMGSGKSTVAKELAIAMGLSAVDLDFRVCERETMTIPELFAERGETGFRVAEHRALKVLVTEPCIVVALGGGTFCSSENRYLIERAQGISVFLDVPWPFIEMRLSENDPGRPVFTNYVDAKILYDVRRADYERADFVLDLSGDESPADIATMIQSSISEIRCAI